LFTKGSEPFNCESLIFIMSYQLAAKRSEELQQLNFKIVIGDEAHYLKSRDS
jgi:SNF2 family DNA or RNA helicase